MPHAARQPRSWLIFDVRQKRPKVLATSASKMVSIAGCLRSERFPERTEADRGFAIVESQYSFAAPAAKRKERVWYPGHFRGKFEIVGVDAKEGMTSRTSVFRLLEIQGCRRMKSFSIQAKSPNKAPEPTPGSVTLRATSRLAEMKQQNTKSKAARSAPAPSVAHL